MWEDYERKNKITKIILAVVAVILAAGLIWGIKLANERDVEAESEFQVMAQQNQADQEAAKAEQLAKIEADYEQDMAVIEQYLPGIVCWGDRLTAGSAGAVSYPSALEELIKTNITNLYDFRSTLDYADNISRVDWTQYKAEIPIVNLGTGEENTYTILGRSGADPYVVYYDITIPAETEQVALYIRSSEGKMVEPLTEGDGGVNPVTIAGIEGTLTHGSEGYNTTYYFTRLEPGEEIFVPAGTEIVTAAADEYLNYFPIIWIGSYGDYSSAEDLVSQIRLLLEHHGNPDRYLVVGLCYIDIYYGGGYNTAFEDFESVMLKAFGDHFINLRKYMASDALADAEMEASKDDEYELSVGRPPQSLRATKDSREFSATGYKLIGQLIYDRMDQLGYFDEIVKELGIYTVREEIRTGVRDENGVTITSGQ